jgi:hypothetical protein
MTLFYHPARWYVKYITPIMQGEQTAHSARRSAGGNPVANLETLPEKHLFGRSHKQGFLQRKTKGWRRGWDSNPRYGY